MDEMTSVRSLRDDAPDPDPARLAPGRHLLLNAAAGGPTRRSRRTLGWRLSAVGATAAVAATALLATQLGASNSPTSQQPPLDDAAALLAMAADAVEDDNGVTEPRPDQWIYERSLLRVGGCDHWEDTGTELSYPSVDGRVDPCAQPNDTIEQEEWLRFDGEKAAAWDYWSEDPTFEVYDLDLDSDERTPQGFWELMESLPTDDPEALLRTLRENTVVHPWGDTQAERDLAEMRILLERAYVFPPRVRAALYRALATIPGVEVVDHLVVDLAGRSAVAVTFGDHSRPDEARYELLLDPETYAYLGSRTYAAEDIYFPRLEIGDTVEVGEDGKYEIIEADEADEADETDETDETDGADETDEVDETDGVDDDGDSPEEDDGRDEERVLQYAAGDLIESTAVLETVVTDEAHPMR